MDRGIVCVKRIVGAEGIFGACVYYFQYFLSGSRLQCGDRGIFYVGRTACAGDRYLGFERIYNTSDQSARDDKTVRRRRDLVGRDGIRGTVSGCNIVLSVSLSKENGVILPLIFKMFCGIMQVTSSRDA